MDPIVKTTRGAVRGIPGTGCVAFKGIPYAAPLDGLRRFQAPVAAPSWDGTRDGSRFSADPPQGTFLPGLPSAWQPTQSTDCLSVNVWTPDPGARGLPVMVWLYGGAFLIGTSRQPDYDGATLAAGGVVVVTVNYRVGFEGFGWLPGVPQNRGFLDQLAALRWVQDNIARFGGDPDNVTLFGESAGATAVAVLTAAGAARGLFHRAIGQSIANGCLRETRARRTTERIAAALGVPATEVTAEAFARIPAEDIHRVQSVPGEITPYGPVIDGDLIVDHPWLGLRPEVDLIAGYNRDEYRLFVLNEPSSVQDPAASAEAFGVSLEDYRAAYPAMSDQELHVLIRSDAIFRIPAIRCAENHPGRSYSYELTWSGPVLGACHGLDVPLTFGSFSGPLGTMLLGNPVPPEAEMLSAQIRKAWLSFAATGDPGWPEYEPGTALTRIWDVPVSVVSDPEATSRRIWARST
ncbi:carboxylesterase family protein [Amycolatopsis cynarae]|uniref:Carboxylic ester hydrolase n=1 Tax=Amycolatopsis cynarae TaxID=2995223 RepID=A0ABY7B2J0_9PSEU|nr:carboxylesterase family protein [Amycolatopsis sp. HUAS 11-8]WAL65458.1 carboxylesterase family protein [Amycolatopsis sp. HUAS 11-8]